MQRELKNKLLASGASVLAAFMMSGAAHAQAAEDGASTTDIIVTANKREQRLQETPTSIGVISGNDLVQRQVTDVQEITRNVAGLNVINQGPGQNTLMIRGLVGAGESTVGLYYDNLPTAGTGESAALAGGRQTDFLVYDAQRVEVLRGPQSTLYGSSALAGVVRILSNPARLGTTEGRVDGEINTVAHGDMGYAIKGMINLPLGEKIAVRLVGYGLRTAGYIDNVSYKEDDFNSSKTWGLRWNTTIEAGPDTTITTQFYTQKLKAGGPSFARPHASTVGGVTLPAAGDYSTFAQSRENYTDRSTLAGINLDHDFGAVTMTAVGSYLNRRNESYTDEQGFPLFFTFLQSVGAFPSVPLPTAITFRSAQNLKLWNGELRFASDFDGPLNFVAGAIYQDRRVKINNAFLDLDTSTGRPASMTPYWYHRVADFRLKQIAAFGELTFAITDELSVLGGARVFKNKRHDVSTSLIPFLRLGSGGVPDDVRSSESKAIFKGEIDYKPNRDFMIYASASQGYRAGGTIVRIIDDLPPSYGPDYTWNFELGAKTSWADNALQANIALYRVNWYDTQINGSFFNGTFEGILNCEGLCARSQGVELDITARPVAGLELTASGTAFKAKWLKAQPAMDGAPAAGTQFKDTPTFTLSGSAAYEWPLSDSFDMTVRIDAQHRGKYAYGDYRPQFNLYAPRAYTLVNASIALARKDSWTATLFARNLFDKRAVLTSMGDTVQMMGDLVSQPRTIGLQLGLSF